jgi:phage gp36-like protein
MAYATADQLKTSVGEQRAKDLLPAVDDATLDQLLATASACIDGEIQSRYEVPIDTTALAADEKTMLDALLAGYAITIAVYQGIALAGIDIPEGIEKAHKCVMMKLKAINLGDAAMPFIDGREQVKMKVIGSALDNELVQNEITHTLFLVARSFA